MSKLKKKTFLVTGGTGFIGSNICRMLIKNGYNVIIYDNNSRGNLTKIKDIKNKITFIKGDIRDRRKVFNTLKKVQAVIHLSYINGTKYFYTHPELILDVGVKGVVNIIDGCIKHKIKELYLASSSEVYQTPLKIPTDENEMLKIPDIFNPRYSYGGGKILTELMGINYGKKFFKKLIIFRPHNVYGPNMGNEHVVPEFVNQLKNKKKINNIFLIKGSGNEKRSFIFIDDFVQAFDLIIKKGKHLNIYNIGTSNIVTIKKLALEISKIMKKKITIKNTKIAKGGTNTRCPNINKILKIGFKQRFSLRQGLESTIFNKNV